MANGRTCVGVRLALVGTVFAAGFVCGALAQRPAAAQIGDAMTRPPAAGAPGPVGDFGATLVDMQDHVSALQKNLDTLKKVKAALGG